MIFDTGSVSLTNTIVLPFGPTNALTTNEITIVMNQGGSTNATTTWTYNASVSEPTSSGILVGGRFDVAGQAYANIARFTTNGDLDTTFNPGTGPDNTVLALGWQLNGQAVVGGNFTHVNGSSYNHIVRLNEDGSIDTTNFFVGSGADNAVYSITLQPLVGTMYVGGAFSSFNGTHRLGFTRLYSNGTVDTTFMDTAYNQFAGLKRIYSYDSPSVFASGVESDGNVLIGGSFNQVGGGQADPKVCNILDDELGLYGLESFADPNLWVEPKSRDGVRNRSGFARLIGGATPGPGNIGLLQTSLSANKSQSSLSVGLVRTNGMLGPVSANFSILPGLAQSGVDYIYDSPAPLYWIAWEYRQNPNQTREHSDGLSGINGFLVDPFGISLNNSTKDALLNNLSKVTVSVIKNPATSGNLSAQFQLANPSCADNFLLGGENIPLGGALGVSTAPYTEIDDTQKPGTFGFSSTSFVATNASAHISVLRSNGVAGIISMRYSTTNGTAVAGADYTGITNQLLTFNQNVISNGFNVAIKDNGFIYTNIQEKTVNLFLSNLGNSPPGATFGISNAVLRLINPNYQGYLTFSATNFTGAMSSGSLAFIVNRVAGSLGSISVQYATADGSALNGVDYSGATGTLNWNSGDVSPRIVTIPLIQTQTVGANKQFSVSLFNPTNSSVGSAPSLLASGVISNATLTIINDNSYGALQFSAPAYNVNENGGYATITVNRTGGAAGTVSVNYATSPGPNAVGGVNYSDTSGVLTFAANQISSSFTVPIKDDGAVDTQPFYFNVSLSNPTNAVLGSLVNAKVNILDVESFNWPPGSPDTGFTSAGMNASVLALALQPNGQMIAGGNFTAVGTVHEGMIARLNQDGSLDTAFLSGLSGANGPVLAVAVQTDNHILIGGSFSSVNGVSRHYISRLNTDGTLDSTFNPGLGADNTVDALAETFVGGVRKIYVGGGFGNVS
ncbi:MAG TPA: Calx-beta domain-containing protein, partial [Candidatus Paceibacterota bacterium]|nr:Calx-beta domain-containing protein [Candidatus Paceibacterota bacterium]